MSSQNCECIHVFINSNKFTISELLKFLDELLYILYIFSGAYTMGTEGQLIESRPLPDIIVKVGAAVSHLPTLSKETHFSVASQITIPFFIAGLGMVLAGIYLDMVQVNNNFYILNS